MRSPDPIESSTPAIEFFGLSEDELYVIDLLELNSFDNSSA